MARAAQAQGINARGQIVGRFNGQGFVTDDGTTFTTFEVPDASFTQAYGINARGQIVGAFQDSLGGLHGFVATPAPRSGR